MYLDTESSKQIDQIRHQLELKGISIDKGTKPHVTLAIYEDLEIESFSEELRCFASNIKP